MSASPLEELSPGQRRRAIARTAIRIVVTTVALFALYIVIPVAGESGARALVELILGLIAFAAILAWLVQSIVKADHPVQRAAEAMAVSVVVLIIVFAYTYLSLSHSSHASFSEPLDHTSAIYFTVSTLGTVGFGDIVGRSHTARLVVTIQILLDLAVLIAIARTLVFAARTGVRRRQETQPGSDPGAASD